MAGHGLLAWRILYAIIKKYLLAQLETNFNLGLPLNLHCCDRSNCQETH